MKIKSFCIIFLLLCGALFFSCRFPPETVFYQESDDANNGDLSHAEDAGAVLSPLLISGKINSLDDNDFYSVDFSAGMSHYRYLVYSQKTLVSSTDGSTCLFPLTLLEFDVSETLVATTILAGSFHSLQLNAATVRLALQIYGTETYSSGDYEIYMEAE